MRLDFRCLDFRHLDFRCLDFRRLDFRRLDFCRLDFGDERGNVRYCMNPAALVHVRVVLGVP